MKKLGLIAAMQKELLPFLSTLGKPEKSESVNNKVTDIYNYAGKKIYVTQSGIGEISAAAAAQHLISCYAVEAVLSFGVCGSLGQYKTMDCVVIKSTVHYDFDLSEIDGTSKGIYPNKDVPYFYADEKLLKKVISLAPDIKSAVCASGDKFIVSKEFKNYLADTFGAQVCDMETAGIYITCNYCAVPCVCVRTISDSDDGAEEYIKFVNTVCKKNASLILKLIVNL